MIHLAMHVSMNVQINILLYTVIIHNTLLLNASVFSDPQEDRKHYKWKQSHYNACTRQN